MSRILVFLGAALLALTSIFHLTGWSEAVNLLDGNAGNIISFLWLVPAVTWGFVAAIWAYSGIKKQPWTIVTTAVSFIPLINGLLMLLIVGTSHPGGYLLCVSSVLAIVGARDLK